MIGILGGTFDPIHRGHLHVATSLLALLPLDEIRLLPCYLPVHRATPFASPEDRLAMTKLACANLPQISVDDHEINRQGPSYMVDTIRDLQQENSDDHLCLILGQDAFQSFDQWKQPNEILNNCHLIIVDRPQSAKAYSPEIQSLIQHHQTLDFSSLEQSPAGKIFFCTINPLDISATTLRQQFKQRIFDETVIPKAVSNYIQEHNLYSH